jgi:IS30 family transposase
VINLDDWAKIRHLFSTGKHSKREIGRLVGVSRGTVERALESDRAPEYQRAAGVSSFDAFAPKVRELLVKTPDDAGCDPGGAGGMVRFRVAVSGEGR